MQENPNILIEEFDYSRFSRDKNCIKDNKLNVKENSNYNQPKPLLKRVASACSIQVDEDFNYLGHS